MTDWKATAEQLHKIATFFFHAHFDSSLSNDDNLFEEYANYLDEIKKEF